MHRQSGLKRSNCFYPQKFTSLICLFFVFCNQALPAYAEFSILPSSQDQENTYTPTQSVDSATIENPYAPRVADNLGDTLSEESPLKPVEGSDLEKTSVVEAETNENYVT